MGTDSLCVMDNTFTTGTGEEILIGGKRLSEEERKEVIAALQCSYSYPTSIIEMLERDDEPEYCTWKEHPVFKGFFHPSCEKDREAHYPGTVDDIKFCPYCGKPVKEAKPQKKRARHVCDNPSQHILCGAYSGNGICGSPKGTCKGVLCG